jgi:hypothetical protein
LPANNSNSYLHNYALAETGSYYFRIKQQDLDGKYSYSIVVKIWYGRNSSIIIAPNPAKDFFEIKGAVTLTHVQLLDASGKLVRSFAPVTNNIYSLRGFARGMYFVKSREGENIQVYKLMIE